ncbi:class II aldolase/adducin family protein [Rubinisphaera margarita]|uniref:class II aldolase/adducin family protein n=1 Tax=Rubinisphaera margarita TaxID=2909586 RepID=UPI001EE88B41|nr:class II aldolase/adducin family protein [Rubinisphaera margarita]MCG6154655.1 class II aldolase/adducin family protein [Rubinisphaera margarita]
MAGNQLTVGGVVVSRTEIVNLRELRQEVCQVNRALFTSGLVTMHSGNASGLDPVGKRMVIKPSGVDYESLTPEMLVEVDVESGEPVDSALRPSVDLPHHLYLYSRMPGIRGIVHTHSNYATAFAACHQPIPLCLTAIADEFGCEIPCASFAECRDNDLGRSIIESHTSAPAILVANHGVFAWGESPRAALKTATVTEDVAKTVHLAMQIGEPRLISAESAAKYYDRYQNRYGQFDDSSSVNTTPR